MPRDGNGSYSLPAGNPVATGTVISSSTHNSTNSDIAAALTQSISSDGQTAWTGATSLYAGSTAVTGSAFDNTKKIATNEFVNINSLSRIDTYAALRLYNGTTRPMFVIGRTNDQDGAAGTFAVDEADTTSADNDGTILVDILGRRWKRQYKDALNVMWFGAVGNGIADDTASIQSAINSATVVKTVYFPNGKYLITSSININISGLTIYGEGRLDDTKITTPNDIDAFRVDIGTGYKYFNTFRNISFDYTGVANQTSGSAIRYYDSTGLQQYGAAQGSFDRLIIRGFYHGILFDKAKLTLWNGFNQIADYGQFLFSGVRIPFSAKTQAFGILFKGGCGAHNTYTELFFQNNIACIRIGDGSTDGGVGDQVFVGNHLLDAQYAIDIIGPSGAGRYNENITITGCHFDGITTNTVQMTRMSNFRIGINNSTATVGINLVSCTNYFIEDRNVFSLPATKLLNSLDTTSGTILDANGTRYAQSMMARRTVNNDFLQLVGGNVNGAGAQLLLHGGAHPSAPSRMLLLGQRVVVQSQNGSVNYLDVDPANKQMLLGDGNWNSLPIALGTYRLWVDSLGKLRIKNGAPTSDTDGTIVGTQS